MIDRMLIACGRCWANVPGAYKGELAQTTPGTIGRARVVGRMRAWLVAHRTPGATT